jgi:hypothetical protein
MVYFGVVHEGRVVLDPRRTEPALKGVLDGRGRLPVLAKLLSRCRACLPSVRHKVACKWYRKTQARYSQLAPLLLSMISAVHDYKVALELQACVGVPDLDGFLLFHCLGVTREIGMAFISFNESWL